MAVVTICTDIPVGADTIREREFEAHLTYIQSIERHILTAGPFGVSSDWAGSLFVYDTDDRDQALSWLANDPYHQAGLYSEVRCFAYLPAAGKWSPLDRM